MSNTDDFDFTDAEKAAWQPTPSHHVTVTHVEPGLSFAEVPAPTSIYEYLDRFIVGQDHVKRKLAVLGYLYTFKQHSIRCDINRDSLPKMNMFITGPTGTGKSELIKRFAECLKLPYHRVDCASLAQSGWSGTSIDDHLEKYVPHSFHYASGILHLDEFDKLGQLVTSSGGGVPALGIQSNFLDLIEGRYYNIFYKNEAGGSTHRNDTALDFLNNSLIIMSGAFESASKEKKKEKTKGMGFAAQLKHKEELNWRKLMEDNNILPEIIGRLTSVVATHELSREQLRELIELKEDSAYNKYKNLLYKFEMSSDELDTLCEKLDKSHYGARDLDYEFFDHVSDSLAKKWGL